MPGSGQNEVISIEIAEPLANPIEEALCLDGYGIPLPETSLDCTLSPHVFSPNVCFYEFARGANLQQLLKTPLPRADHRTAQFSCFERSAGYDRSPVPGRSLSGKELATLFAAASFG